jgi:hypothetical protein
MILKTKREKTFSYKAQYMICVASNKSLSYFCSIYVQEYRHAKIKTLYKMNKENESNNEYQQMYEHMLSKENTERL